MVTHKNSQTAHKKYQKPPFLQCQRTFLGFSLSSMAPRCEKTQPGDLLENLPSHQTETTGYLSRFTNMLEPPMSPKKSAAEETKIGKANCWAPRRKKKHGKIRKVVGQWSINGPCSPIFQSYVKKCHKYWNSMGDWRLWNGVSTVLLCEKTYPLQGQPQFCGAHVHRRNSCFNVTKWGWKKVNMQHSIP